MWSEWPSNLEENEPKQPRELESLVVPPCWDLYIDEDTPELSSIEVNGNIYFADDKRKSDLADDHFITLKSRLIWVREG